MLQGNREARRSLPGQLVAAIEPGWHPCSLKPMAEGPIPTRIWIAEGQPFTLAGAIHAAEPTTVQDPALNMEVEMYEGGVLHSCRCKPQPVVRDRRNW
jgi:hypothetical protein